MAGSSAQSWLTDHQPIARMSGSVDQTGWGARMMRVRLKADGRLVEVLSDGTERPLPPAPAEPQIAAPSIVPMRPDERDLASYARQIRANVKLTQAEFARRIGVPIETVRNWEQGKRAPRGPARALLKVLERVPDVAFSVLRPR
jgi:putative transcriptional regulator